MNFSKLKNYFDETGNLFKNKPVIAFVILWMCYNNYYNKWNKGTERERACRLSQNKKSQRIYEKYKEKILQEFSKLSNEGKKREFVRNVNGKEVFFNAEHCKLKDFLNVVYQIRCNLFHGGKNPFDTIDERLIQWAYKYLYLILHESKSNLF